MYDLIYGDSEIEIEVREMFKDYPKLKIEDASDEVHEERFSIELEINDRDYYKKMMIHGLFEFSLSMGLMAGDEDKKKLIKELIAELRISNPEIFVK